jgi:hypothetical protein
MATQSIGFGARPRRAVLPDQDALVPKIQTRLAKKNALNNPPQNCSFSANCSLRQRGKQMVSAQQSISGSFNGLKPPESGLGIRGTAISSFRKAELP